MCKSLNGDDGWDVVFSSLIDETMAAEYPLAGRGLAKSTKIANRYALLYYDIFGMTKQYSPFEEMLADENEEILCDTNMWRQFGTWLHSHGRQISDPNHGIESGAALGYLSALTTLCSRKFPTHRTWEKNSFDTWYSDVRKDVENTIKRREIIEGDDDVEEGVHDIDYEYLIKLNESWNITGTQEAMIKSCATSLSFFGMGRAGEYALLSGKQDFLHPVKSHLYTSTISTTCSSTLSFTVLKMMWDAAENLVKVLWCDIKNIKQYRLPLTIGVNQYACPYYAMSGNTTYLTC